MTDSDRTSSQVDLKVECGNCASVYTASLNLPGGTTSTGATFRGFSVPVQCWACGERQFLRCTSSDATIENLLNSFRMMP